MTEPTNFIGYALIVNVKYFQPESGQNDREDTISDQTNSLAAFKRLGFETKLVTEVEPLEEDDIPTNFVTRCRFQTELVEAMDHVQSKGYQHFAVFISTHGEETEKEGMYVHELCFSDGDAPTKEILFDPLDRELNQVNKLVLVQACRGRDDELETDEDLDPDEDLGVLIEIVDDPAQEYQTSGTDTRVRETESSTSQLHYSPPSLQRCVTMFASPSGKAAYRNYLASLFWERVRILENGTRVNLLDLLRQINRRFAEEEISMSNDEDGVVISYDVCNVSSISHCLTKPIYYTIVRQTEAATP